MTLLQIAFTFTVTWWVMLFAFISRGSDASGVASANNYAGAPVKTNLKRKLLWNTLASAIVTLGIYLLLTSGLVPLRDVIQ